MQQRVTSRQQAKLLAYNQAAQHFESLAYVKAAERCFEKCIDKNFQLDKSCHESCVDKFKQTCNITIDTVERRGEFSSIDYKVARVE